jgi:hypothetical protein
MCDGQLHVLRVFLIVQNDVGYVCNYPCVICGAIDIVDGDQLSEATRGDAIKLCPLDVNEATSGATVNEGLSASSDCAIR